MMDIEWLRRNLGDRRFDWETTGPEEDELPVCRMSDVLNANFGAATNGGVDAEALGTVPTPWSNGWWLKANRLDANKGRMGGTIVPQVAVVHTTDMTPDTFWPLVKQWQASGDNGACAHGVLGRDPSEGFVQMVPITRNGNHAGGPVVDGKVWHGWWRTPEGAFIHPNSIAVGIEIHCAGRLRWKESSGNKTAELYSYPMQKVIWEFTREECYIDEMGRPWHAVTQYQLERLEEFLLDLHPSMKPSTSTWVADKPYSVGGYWDQTYARTESQTLVGHVTLDPANKSDPGPQVMAFIREIARKQGWR